MYLIHVLVIHTVETILTLLHACTWYAVVPAAYLVSFAGATVLFYLVERPCLAYGRKLSKRMRESQASRSESAASRMSFSHLSNPMESAITPIEREEPGVPNDFANEVSEGSGEATLSWAGTSSHKEDK
jgi:hypothetical protein